MGQLVDFIRAPAKIGRNIGGRLANKTPEVIAKAKEFGFDYWDGDRKYGYGGYSYDGRWRAVATRLIEHYRLKTGDKVLDIGCGKGFLVYDLVSCSTPMNARGIDISDYAIENSFDEIRDRLMLGSAVELPFETSEFDLVVSFNALHNLSREDVKLALREINRVSKSSAFVQVDSYTSTEEKKIFEDWVLTAEFHDYPDGWLSLFEEVGYNGDYFWTVIK